MALATYTDLLTQVPLWLARPTDLKLLPSVPDWITMCEERIAFGRGKRSQFPSEKLRIRAMENMIPLVLQPVSQSPLVAGDGNNVQATISGVTGYTTGLNVELVPQYINTGAATLSVNNMLPKPVYKSAALLDLAAGDLLPGATYNFYFDGVQFILLSGNSHVPLPVGYLSAREVYLDTNPRGYLDFIVPDVMNRLYGSSGSGHAIGQPRAYTIEGDSIRFAPSPDTTYYFWIDYYQKFPALQRFQTNWLLQNAPSVYLYGTLIESAPFIGHDNRLPLWYSMFQAAIDGLQEQDEDDRHSGALLTMRPQHRTP